MMGSVGGGGCVVRYSVILVRIFRLCMFVVVCDCEGECGCVWMSDACMLVVWTSVCGWWFDRSDRVG